MGVTAIWACAMMLGVDVGWQPHPGGGIEYIIQIEPRLLEVLKAGEEIRSSVPPSLGQVRVYRIRVGEEELPREWGEGPPPAGAPGSGRPAAIPEGPAAPSASTANRAPGGDGAEGSPPGRAMPGEAPGPGNQPPKPLPGSAERAVYIEQEGGPSAEGPRGGEGEEASQPAGRPWLPLTLALAGLFAAVGGMLYFGWIAWDYRLRYRGLLERLIAAGGEADSVIDLPGLRGASRGEPGEAGCEGGAGGQSGA